MSSDLVVTSWSADGYRLYGKRFLKTFKKHWDEPLNRLVLYLDTPAVHAGIQVRYTGDISEWAALTERWKHDPAVHGWTTPEYPRPKDYSYLWDAARFAVKVFVWRDAARKLRKGTLTWLDGDTTTKAEVITTWPQSLLRGYDVAYLGRGPMHPETGFVCFRIPEALPLLDWCCEAYLSGAFRMMADGWTDCHVLRAGLTQTRVRAIDLTRGKYQGDSNIWLWSPLCSRLEHAKGIGRKREADE